MWGILPTTQDAYHNIAGVYDRLFEAMNQGLRLAGLKLCGPINGANVLDVGCGTGTYLELFRRIDCNLYGLDLSPSMLEVARRRLGRSAELELGDATHMPYPNDKFDLVITMLSLHEMRPDARSAAITEMKRVLKTGGRALLIDFGPGPYRPLKGWYSKAIIFLSELAAGREHYANYRHFMANGALGSLVAQNGLAVENRRILAGGAFAICLAGHSPAHQGA
jgi:ubiquinone/menaquinone biosynthesis C-methylase UbiE